MLIHTKNFLYFEVEQLFYHSESLRYRVSHWLVLCLIVLVKLRLIGLIALLAFPRENLYLLWRYDPIATYVALNSHQYDPYFMCSLLFFCMYMFEINRSMYFTPPDRIAWQDVNDLCVRLYDAYVQAKKSKQEVKEMQQKLVNKLNARLEERTAATKILNSFFVSTYFQLYAKILIWLKLHHITVSCFQSYPLNAFRYLSLKNRVKMLRMLLVMNKFNYCSIMLIVWYVPALLFDLSCIQFIVSNLLRISLLLFNTAFLITTCYRDHISEANAQLRRVIQSVKQKYGFKLQFASTRVQLPLRTLNYFLTQHTDISMRVQYLNRKIWCHILLISLLTQIPINVYYSYRLIYRNLSTTETSITRLILSIQFVFVSGALLPLAQYSKAIHKSATLLPTVQHLLRGNEFICLKLKYLNLFERITCKEIQYGHTIGDTNKTINYRTILEIFLVYIGYLLYVFGFLNSKRS